jgi:transcriptional regulator with XRE-family HTH domain
MRLNTSNGSTTAAKDRQRLKAARLNAEVSLRSVAKRMKVPISTARAQEEGNCDLRLSDLCRWQGALQVPLAELLLEPPTAGLSEPVRQRACLVRLAKTANTLLKKCSPGANRRLASRMVDEVEELMPEAKEVGTWPEVGVRRTLDELGRAADEIPTGHWPVSPID